MRFAVIGPEFERLTVLGLPLVSVAASEVAEYVTGVGLLPHDTSTATLATNPVLVTVPPNVVGPPLVGVADHGSEPEVGAIVSTVPAPVVHLLLDVPNAAFVTLRALLVEPDPRVTPDSTLDGQLTNLPPVELVNEIGFVEPDAPLYEVPAATLAPEDATTIRYADAEAAAKPVPASPATPTTDANANLRLVVPSMEMLPRSRSRAQKPDRA